MGAAEIIAFEEVRARKQWDALRQELHTRFDEWLDGLEAQLRIEGERLRHGAHGKGHGANVLDHGRSFISHQHSERPLSLAPGHWVVAMGLTAGGCAAVPEPLPQLKDDGRAGESQVSGPAAALRGRPRRR